MTSTSFITDFLRNLKSPRLSLEEPSVDKELILRIASADESEITETPGPNSKCVRSLLFLAAGAVDDAHRIVQQLPSSDAAYIHGMIHRVDDDFDNARYWFRRAGTIPAFFEMFRRAREVSPTVARQSVWNPSLVTDLMEESRENGVSEELRSLAKIEFETLLQFLSGSSE